MPLTPARLADLLQPYTAAATELPIDWPRVHTQLIDYVHLLMKWNARVNLTAIHSPDEIVRRHFGESLFAGLHLRCSTWNIAQPDQPKCSTWNTPPSASSSPPESLLDFGSGAGFPGLPIQILWPELPVTLAESRHKKAAFLREVVRSLGLKTQVWAERVESMPPERTFAAVTMRAVDDMEAAVAAAAARAANVLLVLGTTAASYPFLAPEFSEPELTPIPETNDGVLMLFRRT
jgi:16S rRNA (guanine527-N7)-methyltransferase